ncbi:Dihydrolipoamide acyltransferase [Giardia duodenalis]|uniref:Dihydrolipoamide acyltransferase n=1 Tax=Giardia intestinalis TaxID=5741 RepID=V6TPA4_GIAIN|nr:Dihydrolipoamide acyltransferase [Giardia intestinalis]
MRGLLTDEERAVKERHGSVLDHEARHDRPCLYPRLSGSSTRSWRSDAQPPPTRTRAGHLAHRQCRTIDVGVTLPRQMDHYCNEKLRKHRDGTPDRLRNGSPPSPGST